MSQYTKIISAAASIICMACTSAYAAEDSKDPYEDNLLGHWGGLRDKMADAGIDASVEYKADILDNTSGGKKTGTNYLDNMDIKFALDNEKLLGIKGNKALIYFLNNDGKTPNASHVGSLQGIDNIEVSTTTFKLYEAWDEQTFLNNKLAVLLGLHDLNSEFSETDMTANFLKPTMQIGQSFAQSGQNAPSIFPTTSLAARVKVMPTDTTYASVAAFEGIPGNPNDAHGTHIHLRSRDGALLVAEAGCTPNNPEGADSTVNKFAVGAWSYTKKMDDQVDVDGSGNPVPRRMDGAYLLSSYQIYADKTSGHDIGVFFRAGISDGDTAQVDWDYVAGFVGHGWIPTRPDGELGIGISQSHNDNKYMQSVSYAADRYETGYELYYRDKVMKGVSIQPDVQYITNPGTDQVTKNAWVFGMRLDVSF